MTSFDEQHHPQVRQLVHRLFAAQAQGNSCIETDFEEVAILEKLLGDVQENLPKPFVYDGKLLYLYRYFQLEQRVATQVMRLQHATPTQVDMQQYEHLLNDEYQKQALFSAGEHAFNIITGGPGTGKTYTLARIVAALKHSLPELRIAMAAPTGKAAQRMQEALQASFKDEHLLAQNLLHDDLFNLQPVTLHRLLGIGMYGQPRYQANYPLPFDLIVVDEASMLDLKLAAQLLEAIPSQARLILLGDAQQLASVDIGSVLADLQHIPSLQENRTHLRNSRRFSDHAYIGKMATFIQNVSQQKLLEEQVLDAFEQQVVFASALQKIDLSQLDTDCVQLQYLDNHAADFPQTALHLLWQGFENYAEMLFNYAQSKDSKWVEKIVQCFDEYRILTAIHHGDLGLARLNQFMEQQLLAYLATATVKQGNWYIGRPVMMTENDYQLGLSNGDIGICFYHRDNAAMFEVYFPSLNKWLNATRLPQHIQTAFALTIHKSQGSEFSHVAVVLDHAATKLLSQELIYTAITRAKQAVSLLVDKNAFIQALTQKTSRQSGLIKKINN
ncbi:exodeoxyribonuclease V subunit alpha [Acinetobacter sp. MD2(2019)]|uniref:exodeoxyribonuclease V subunit alpha n=1 Tax=Acinetobacter sp. MD2(2019) TaxID=2605273 RepID=UPI002D1EE399|nr:exodeoxyribonuclease V subunit alpha [Acinetobacter sp. MD2(2019)]